MFYIFHKQLMYSSFVFSDDIGFVVFASTTLALSPRSNATSPMLVPPSSFFRLAPMRKGEADGERGLRLEGDITVVAGKSGGKWEIQRPGDKWLITAGERESVARSACLVLRGRRQGMGRIHRGHWAGTRNCMDAKLGTVMYADAGPAPATSVTSSHVYNTLCVCLLRKMITSVSILSVLHGLLTRIHIAMNLEILCEFIILNISEIELYMSAKNFRKSFSFEKHYNSIV